MNYLITRGKIASLHNLYVDGDLVLENVEWDSFEKYILAVGKSNDFVEFSYRGQKQTMDSYKEEVSRMVLFQSQEINSKRRN